MEVVREPVAEGVECLIDMWEPSAVPSADPGSLLMITPPSESR